MQDKLQKFKDLLKLVDEGMTKQEFVSAFDAVVKLLQEMKKMNSEEMRTMKKMCEDMMSKIQAEHSDNKSETQQMMSEMTQRMITKIDQRLGMIKDGLDGMKGEQGIQGEQGQKGDKGDDGNPDTPNQIIEKISGIIEISDIKDLKDILEEIKKIKNERRMFGGGGFSKIAHDIHQMPNEIVDGSGTTFTLAHVPNPATSLKLYGLGQRLPLTTKYSLSGRTITTVDTWSAGDILADYEI